MFLQRGIFAALSLALILGAWASPAVAQAPSAPPAVIRPSKLLTTEFADTLQVGTHLLSLYTGGFELGVGLPAHFQLDLGGGDLVFTPALQAPLYAHLKERVWSNGLASLGWGAMASSNFTAAGPGGSAFVAYLPITLTLHPGLLINLAPKLTFAGSLAPGFAAGAAYFVSPTVGLIAEDTLSDLMTPANQQIVLGLAYLGLGPRASLLGGLVISGGNTRLLGALAVGF